MPARTPHRRPIIDWPGLVLAIRSAGVTLDHASTELGKHRKWLGQIARGEVIEPSFSDGVRLVDYAYDLLGPKVLSRYGAIERAAA